MKSIVKHAWIVWGVSLAVFVVLAFIFPFAHTSVFWLAFGCSIVIFCATAFSFYRAFHKDETMQSKLLGWPIFRTGFVVLAIQVIVAFLLMIIAGFLQIKWAILAETLVFAFATIALVVREAARETIISSETRLHDNTEVMKSLRLTANGIAATISDPASRTAMEKFSDELKYSDPVSSSTTAQYEDTLINLLHQIQDMGKIGDSIALIQQASDVLKKRNIAAKNSKK